MKQSLRKTSSQLLLTYKYGEAGERLVGRHFALIDDGDELTLSIDLTPNFHTRSKTAPVYLDAVNLIHNHKNLASLQCGDNLVRARLIKSWYQVSQPRLRMCLDLGQRGRYMYSVQPHSLFAGGIQLDVREVLEEDARVSRPLAPTLLDNSRNHP